MNKLEIQQNSQDCIDINDEATTVYMKHAGSLGELNDPFTKSNKADVRSWT